jgi:hypothetical protein
MRTRITTISEHTESNSRTSRTGLGVGLGLVLAVALATAVTPSKVEAQAASLADLLIAASGGGELDDKGRDYDMILQTVITLEDLGGDADLGGATLLEVLSDPNAQVTVFAPRDRAMRRLARDLGWDGNGGDSGALAAIVGTFDLETIRNVVKYHVVGIPLTLIEVLRTKQFDTVLPGSSFTRSGFSLRDNDPDLGNPRLSLPLELEGGQSIAHTINRVLIPIDL